MAEPTEQFQALFDPAGVVVAGASTHPGKFGFVALHNILANGYAGRVFATNRDAAPVLGIDTVPSLDDIPDGEADLVFVCTPAATNPDAAAGRGGQGHPGRVPGLGRLRRGRRRGRAGPGRAGRAGRRAGHPARRAQRPGRGVDAVVAVRPDRGALPAGRAHRRGQPVGQLRVVVHELRLRQRASASAGPCRPATPAMVGVTDFLDFYADDPATDVALAYVEGITDGRALLRASCARWPSGMPVVLVKGGATSGGASGPRPATPARWPPTTASSTACAARPASSGPPPSRRPTRWPPPSPPSRVPKGTRVAVVTTAGGWGVVTADAIAGTRPRADGAARRPASPRSTPSCRPAGAATTRSTWPAARPRTPSPTCWRSSPATPTSTRWCCWAWASSPTRRRMEHDGPFYPDHGLERIVAFHDRQDAPLHRGRGRRSAAELGKPVLVATELAVTFPDNAAVRGTVRGRRALLPLVQPGRDRPRPPLALRPVARRRRHGLG